MAKNDREVTFHDGDYEVEGVALENGGYAAVRKEPQATGKPKSIGSLAVKLTLDTSQAVAELKRLQRVARETTQCIREVESAGQPLQTFTTQELADELARRNGVKEIVAGNDDYYEVKRYKHGDWITGNLTAEEAIGSALPARILVIDEYESRR